MGDGDGVDDEGAVLELALAAGIGRGGVACCPADDALDDAAHCTIAIAPSS